MEYLIEYDTNMDTIWTWEYGRYGMVTWWTGFHRWNGDLCSCSCILVWWFGCSSALVPFARYDLLTWLLLLDDLGYGSLGWAGSGSGSGLDLDLDLDLNLDVSRV